MRACGNRKRANGSEAFVEALRRRSPLAIARVPRNNVRQRGYGPCTWGRGAEESCKVLAAGMAQHVGPDAAELGLLTRKPDNVAEALAGQLGLPFGQEQTSIKRASFLVSCSFKMEHRYYLVNLTAWRRRKLAPKHSRRQPPSHPQS